MKIVINTCFGGYSLSSKAVKRLAELQGKACYFFLDGIGDKPFREVDVDNCDSMFWSAFTVKDPNVLNKGDKNWGFLSPKEKDDYNKLYKSLHLDRAPSDRTDELLIQVIEELGKEANGICADLKIIEIPDDIEYEITEYDGLEKVEEIHKSWS